jgi:hypothetical protein
MRDQIEEYEDKLEKSFKAGVITGIVQPSFISECKNWRFLPYSYICDEIVKIAQKKETGFQQQIILEYAKMFRQLSDYISGIIAASHEKWISVIDFVPLQSLRMEDVVKKLKACELADYLKSKLQSLPARVGDYELKFGFDYSHTHPIVNIRYEQEADKSKVSVIGIQIEQTQYRWCVQIDKRISFEEEKALFDRYCDYGLFVPYDGNLMTIKGRTTSLNRPYRTYGGPSSKSRVNYSFIYQYCDIVDPSYEELSKQIEQDMLFVTKLLQN